jgi:hypothetical protein
MRTRPIALAALSVLTTLASASTALAHSRGADDGPLLSLDSLALAVMTSLVLGAVCFVVMVWDPPTRRK